MLLVLMFNICFLYPEVSCGYSNHSALTAVVFTYIEPPDEDVHSEYYYGRCATPFKTVLARVTWTYPEIKNKLIVRGWLNVTEEPNCVYLRAKSTYSDIVRYHAFKFNVCVCRLVYNYAGYKFVYYYYEWYIPMEMRRDITWDLLFYGRYQEEIP